MSVGNDGMNGFMGIFGLLILLGILNGGFGGGFGGGNGNSNAIQNDINRGFDNQNLQAQSRDILGAVSAGTAQSVAASNQVYHDVVNNLSDKYMELARDIAGVQGSVAQAIANQNECCCSTKLLISESTAGLSAQIAQNKYDNALALAGLEQRLTSKMDQNEITSLRDQVQQLQLAQATAGMLRFPNAWTYNGGVFPPVTPATGA
jgi:hypothetical protein